MASIAGVPIGRRGQERWARRLSYTQDALLVVLSAVFCYVHAHALFEGHLTSVGFAAEQGLLAVLFLTRRRSIETSTRLWDWAIASTGWVTLFGRPADGITPGLEVTGTVLQLVGLSLTVVGFCYLGRSFGVVAANRGLKGGGPYMLVRHPIYMSHMITMGGFVIANPSAVNAILVTTASVGMLLRIQSEERLLTRSAGYDEYKARVRWRLVPGLY